MIERINNRQIFYFSYLSYGLIKIFTACVCCQRYLLRKWSYYRDSWFAYQKYKRARIDLRREKDVEHMIYNMRILRFMQKTTLKKRQRDIVQYFMRYLIEDDEINEQDISRRNKTAAQLVEGFDPVNDPYDRRILFEVAKRRVEENDYAEDTSFEEEDNAGQGEEEQEERRESLAFLRRLLNSARVDGQTNDEVGDEHGFLMSIPAPDRS